MAPRVVTDSAEHPLDALEMYFTEPVVANTAGTLADADGTPTTLTHLDEQQSSGAFWGDLIVSFTLEQTDDECGLALCGEMGALIEDIRVE